MSPYRVLISGAGVAGLSLAYWLARAGMSLSIVERAPRIRLGGQAVDFRGKAHRTVLHEMGIFDGLCHTQTRMAPIKFLGEGIVPNATLPSEFAGGEIEVLRGTLLTILASIVSNRVRYFFDDTITALQQEQDGVLVSFRKMPPEKYDFVVGADGLRSNVRRLAFGDDREYTREFGYAIVSASIPREPWKEQVGLFLSRPGRCGGISGTEKGEALGATFFFATDAEPAQWRNPQVSRQAISAIFASDGWILPELARLVADAETIYCDSISSVELSKIWNGRIVLVGDAAHGGTVGGMGTGVAVVDAYVLAHELLSDPANYATKFQNYQERTEPYARTCRSGAANVGPFFAPKSKFGIWRRNVSIRLLECMPGKGVLEGLANSRANNIDLSKYGQQ